MNKQALFEEKQQLKFELALCRDTEAAILGEEVEDSLLAFVCFAGPAE
jgi:hypothetical protein